MTGTRIETRGRKRKDHAERYAEAERSVLFNYYSREEEQEFLELMVKGERMCSMAQPSARWCRVFKALQYTRPKNTSELKRVHAICAHKHHSRPESLVYYQQTKDKERAFGVCNSKAWPDRTKRIVQIHRPTWCAPLTPEGDPVKMYFMIDLIIDKNTTTHSEVENAVLSISKAVTQALAEADIEVDYGNDVPLIEIARCGHDGDKDELSINLVFDKIVVASPVLLHELCRTSGPIAHQYRNKRTGVSVPWRTDVYGDWKPVPIGVYALKRSTGTHASSKERFHFSDLHGNELTSPNKTDLMRACVSYTPSALDCTTVDRLPQVNSPVDKANDPDSVMDMRERITRGIGEIIIQRRRELPGRPAPIPKEEMFYKHDRKLLKVHQSPTVKEEQELSLETEFYCEHIKGFHSSPVWFVLDTTKLTYYQTDDVCRHHLEENKKKRVVRCANPFFAAEAKHAVSKVPVCTLKQAYDDGRMMVSPNELATLFAHYHSANICARTIDNDKYTCYYYNETSKQWNDSVKMWVEKEFPVFIKNLEEYIFESVGEIPTVEQIVARQRALKGFRYKQLTGLIVTASIGRAPTRIMNHASPHLIPHANGRVFDAITGEDRDSRAEDLFSRRMKFKLLPESNRKVHRLTKWLRQVFIDQTLSPEDQDALWDERRKWLGYCFMGFTSDRHGYLFEGTGLNGKTVVESLFLNAMGTWATMLNQNFLTAKGANNESAESASPVAHALGDLRVALIKEPVGDCAMNESRWKSMVSGDTITARALRKAMERVYMQLKLIGFCNKIPRFSNDKAVMDRLFVSNTPAQYVDELPKDNEVENSANYYKKDGKSALDINTKFIDAFGSIACYGARDLLREPAAESTFMVEDDDYEDDDDLDETDKLNYIDPYDDSADVIGRNIPPRLHPYHKLTTEYINEFKTKRNTVLQWIEDEMIQTDKKIHVFPVSEMHYLFKVYSGRKGHIQDAKKEYETFERDLEQTHRKYLKDCSETCIDQTKWRGKMMVGWKWRDSKLQPTDGNYTNARSILYKKKIEETSIPDGQKD